MAELANYKGIPVIDSPCRIDVLFRFAAKTITSPKIGDLDNLLKAVWDGLVQTGLIADDRFIVETHTKKETAEHDQITITASLLRSP